MSRSFKRALFFSVAITLIVVTTAIGWLWVRSYTTPSWLYFHAADWWRYEPQQGLRERPRVFGFQLSNFPGRIYLSVFVDGSDVPRLWPYWDFHSGTIPNARQIDEFSWGAERYPGPSHGWEFRLLLPHWLWILFTGSPLLLMFRRHLFHRGVGKKSQSAFSQP